MRCVNILIVRCIRKGLNTKNIEIPASVRQWRLQHWACGDDFTTLRDRNQSCELARFPNSRNIHSFTRNEVAEAVETVTSSCAFATGPDFDVKNATKRYLTQSRVFCNSIQADIILAAGGKECSLVFLMIPFTVTLLGLGRQHGLLYSILLQHLPVTLRCAERAGSWATYWSPVLCLAFVWAKVKRPSLWYTSTRCAYRLESKKASKHHSLPTVEWFSTGCGPYVCCLLWNSPAMYYAYFVIGNYAPNEILVKW